MVGEMQSFDEGELATVRRFLLAMRDVAATRRREQRDGPHGAPR
jgi:hypothetical protein